jgi:2'-5' RNA ligase
MVRRYEATRLTALRLEKRTPKRVVVAAAAALLRETRRPRPGAGDATAPLRVAARLAAHMAQRHSHDDGGRGGRGQSRDDRRRKCKVPTLRLFTGIYPPQAVVTPALAALRDLDLPAHRRTEPDQMHLTLLFIGDVELKPPGALDEVVESVERAVAGIPVFHLQTQHLIALPKRGPVRLIALTTDLPSELLELHDRLARRLAQRVRRRPSDRFLPHLTLCRFRTPTNRAGLRDAIEGVSVRAPAFEVTAVHLMKSTLLPGGAVHEVVARGDLEQQPA